MKRHYNIYYIFLEDKEKHPLPEVKDKAIREKVGKKLIEFQISGLDKKSRS